MLQQNSTTPTTPITIIDYNKPGPISRRELNIAPHGFYHHHCIKHITLQPNNTLHITIYTKTDLQPLTNGKQTETIIHTDQNWILTQYNPQGEQLTTYTIQDLQTKPIIPEKQP